MKPSEYDDKTRDARIVDTWLLRMTNYLTLTNIEENKKVGFTISYLTSDALDWYMINQTTLAASTFDNFKTSLRDHFIPQNYKNTTYNQYKHLKQDILSISKYSSKMKSLADQVSELVTLTTRDLDFIDDFFHDIKRFIISQSSIEKET